MILTQSMLYCNCITGMHDPTPGNYWFGRKYWRFNGFREACPDSASSSGGEILDESGDSDSLILKCLAWTGFAPGNQARRHRSPRGWLSAPTQWFDSLWKLLDKKIMSGQTFESNKRDWMWDYLKDIGFKSVEDEFESQVLARESWSSLNPGVFLTCEVITMHDLNLKWILPSKCSK